jgi:predicted metal-dependent HD superfamily phosphohydrolase
MASIEQWRAVWRALGAAGSPTLDKRHSDVVARYGEAHRHYHTVRHLDACLAHLRLLESCVEQAADVEIALWFHDAIYDTRRNDNEIRSAEWAAASVHSLAANDDAAARVFDLVMATRHSAEPQGVDAQAVVDVDLAILGAGRAAFDEYERQIRLEYRWVPAPLYRQARRDVLQGFIGREHIYSTPPFRARYEAAARANLERSLASL